MGVACEAYLSHEARVRREEAGGRVRPAWSPQMMHDHLRRIIPSSTGPPSVFDEIFEKARLRHNARAEELRAADVARTTK